MSINYRSGFAPVLPRNVTTHGGGNNSDGGGSTHTWTKPSWCTRIRVRMVGGGGGGGGHGECGGAGGYVEKSIHDLTGVNSVAVTIGGGGNHTHYHHNAGNGGTSSFGSYCSATGGSGSNVE